MSHVLLETLNRWRQEAKVGGKIAQRELRTVFEKLCQVFLLHDETQKQGFAEVLTFGEWADRHGLDRSDRGIDLVAELRDGSGWCAVQCKILGHGHED